MWWIKTTLTREFFVNHKHSLRGDFVPGKMICHVAVFFHQFSARKPVVVDWRVPVNFLGTESGCVCVLHRDQLRGQRGHVEVGCYRPRQDVPGAGGELRQRRPHERDVLRYLEIRIGRNRLWRVDGRIFYTALKEKINIFDWVRISETDKFILPWTFWENSSLFSLEVTTECNSGRLT